MPGERIFRPLRMRQFGEPPTGRQSDTHVSPQRQELAQAATSDGRASAKYALSRTSERGDVDKVRALVKNGTADVNAVDAMGEATSLHYAAAEGHAQIVALLLRAKADPDAVDDFDRTPLYWAAQMGHVPVAELLLDAYADIDAADKDGQTPLHVACRWQKSDVTQLLLASGASLHDRNKNGRAPVHECLLRSEYPLISDATLKTLRVLVEYGAEWDATCDSMVTQGLACEEAAALSVCMQLWLRQRVEGAPLTPVPFEIVLRGVNATKAFLEDLQRVVVLHNVCVVGPSCSGKTSLFKSISQRRPHLEHADNRTLGVDYHRFRFERVDATTRTAELHDVTVWDVSGQKVHEAMRSILHTPRMTYLVLVDLEAFVVEHTQVLSTVHNHDETKSLDDFVDMAVMPWIRDAIARQADAEVVFVMSKIDVLDSGTRAPSGSLKGAEALVQNLANKLRVICSPLGDKKLVRATCTSFGSVHMATADMEQVLLHSKHAHRLSDVESKVLDIVVRKLASEDHARRGETIVIDVEELCDTLEATVSTQDPSRVILRTLHDVGRIILFDAHGPDGTNKVVIHPKVLAGLIHQVIQDEIASGQVHELMVKRLQEHLALALKLTHEKLEPSAMSDQPLGVQVTKEAVDEQEATVFAGENARADDTSMDMPSVLYNAYPFRVGVDQRYDMMRFVRAAVDCDATVFNEFLLRVGHNDDVRNKVRALAAARFSVADRTFQDVALPLLQLLGSHKFLESVHTTDVKRVLRVVLLGEPLFLRRVRNCLEHETAALNTQGLLVDSADAVARVLHALVRKLPDSAQDDDVYELIAAVAEWVHTCDYADGLTDAASILDDALEMCFEFVPARRALHNEEPQPVDYLVRTLRTGLSLTANTSGPTRNAAFARGPRHDNDDAVFRDVRVIPTDLEMRSLEPPYLPTRTRVLPNDDVRAAMEQHLDLHFRLLREDVLAQIRRGVQWALRPSTLATCLRSKVWTPPRAENVPLLNVALGARLEQLHGSIHRGVMFQVSAAQPIEGNKAKRKEFWDREQRYKPGSLVCIAVDVATDGVDQDENEESDEEQFPRYASLGAGELIFATVAENTPEDLYSNPERFSVKLKLLETSRTAELVTTLTNPKPTNLLMEVRGLFFAAYEPILRSLQLLDARSLSQDLQQCLYGDRDAAWQRKPAYARSLGTYNLHFLVKPNLDVRVDLARVPGDSYATLVRHLQAYEERGYLTLDRSQCQAFAAALTQQVCLIQGPPGTGKSYVGTKIVLGILNQGVNTGPILCVCYTNHALDQFLEGLVADGLPLDAIVRVGSRSKSELLEKRSLNALKRDSSKLRQEHQRFNKLYAECRGIQEEYLEDFVASSTSSTSFLNWMRSNQPTEFAAIAGLADDEGFQDKGQRKKDHRQRWHAWKHDDKPKGTGIWSMPLADRQALVASWEEAWRASVQASIRVKLDEYQDNVAEAEEVTNAQLLRILRKCKVVGVTTTGCAIHHALIRALAPKIVVCEEAGEVLEAHLLACLTKATEQLIQIGDHMQLRPILNEYELSRECTNRGPRYDLDVSMFERLVNEREHDDVPGALVTLHVQRRMRPEICDLVRRTLYPQLEDGPQVYEYPQTRGFTHNLWFFDHDEREDTNALSHTNAFEADFVVELVAHAIKQGYGADEITILTPYLGQLVQIRRRLLSRNFRFALEEADEDALLKAGVEDEEEEKQQVVTGGGSVVVKTLKECVRLSTVDNFQGNESHLVFISTVRSNSRGSTGFLKTFNRVNVMLSRAKSAMFILGSASTVRRSRSADMFNKVLDLLEANGAMGRTIGLRCERHGTVSHVASAAELREQSPDGGCHVPCDQRLPCGHSCPRLCHADDTRHVAALCMEPCVKRVAVCGHLCRMRCHEVCRCREVIKSYDLPCGHALTNVACSDVHTKGQRLACRAMVTVRLPFCGHEMQVRCAKARTLERAIEEDDWAAAWRVNVQCDVECGGPQDCDHACQHPCGQCLASNLAGSPADASRDAMTEAAARPRRGDHHFGTCGRACDRVLLCGHACKSTCHAAGECPPCPLPCRSACTHSKCPEKCKDACASCAQPCVWSCPHVGTCELPCGSPCTRLPCDARCPKTLACGHQCPGLCGEPCLSSAYCHACPPSVATHRDDVVDPVMFATLGDHDPNDSPLVQLRCGHCFTVETLDGWLQLGDFYTRDVSGQWTDVRPLRPPTSGDATHLKGCPTCRAPVAGVFRYGRLVNFFHVHQSERKFFQAAMAEIVASKHARATTMAASTRNRWIHTFGQMWKKPTPTQDVWTKESSQLARLGGLEEALNLVSFRNIMQHQAVVRVGLELLALLVDKIKSMKSDVMSDGALKRAYKEGCEVESKVVALARESNAQRSEHEAQLLGMELRVAWLQNGRADDAARTSVLRHLKDSKERLQQTASSEMRARAERLDDMAQRLGHLTKSEKDEIFRVFATSTNEYARGFGGHWYQCPSGHPYVITDCGGAMERATCPECGAPIGGENHLLDVTNAPATAFFS